MNNLFPCSHLSIQPDSYLAGKTLPNAILSAKTVQEIFTPALSSSGANSLDSLVGGLGIPPGNQWSSALALRTQDWPEKRKKGSAYCMFIVSSVL